MEPELTFLRNESDIVNQIKKGVEEFNSWSAFLGPSAWAWSASAFQQVLQKPGAMDKLDHAVLGLNSMTTNIRILKQLHQKGVLRVIKNSSPHFSNHSYSFQSKGEYAALLVNGQNFTPLENTAPLMSGIVVRCSLSHLFVNQAESFFREFKNQSTIMSSAELDQLEERMTGRVLGAMEQEKNANASTTDLPYVEVSQSQVELVEKALSSAIRWPLWNRLREEAKQNSQDIVYALEMILWNAFGQPHIPDNPTKVYVCTKCGKFPATIIVDGKRYCNDCLA